MNLPSPEQILANEWLVVNRKTVRHCPHGATISEYACEKRMETLPHQWKTQGEETTSYHFMRCLGCQHYKFRETTKEQREFLRKQQFNNQERIEKYIGKKRNKKRDV